MDPRGSGQLESWLHAEHDSGRVRSNNYAAHSSSWPTSAPSKFGSNRRPRNVLENRFPAELFAVRLPPHAPPELRFLMDPAPPKGVSTGRFDTCRPATATKRRP